MRDPVERFLGWQVDKESGRNFNSRVMEETLAFINAELANYPENPSGSQAPAQPQSAPTNAFIAQPSVAPEPTPTHVNPFTGGEAEPGVTPTPTSAPWGNPGFAQNPWGTKQ